MTSSVQVIKKKVVLLGDGSVGKTSLVRRYVFDMYDDEYVSTIGTKVSSREMVVGKWDVKLLIWDVLGQSGFTSVQSTAISGAEGAILVADLTKRRTLESLDKYWVPLVKEYAGEVPLIIFGNKIDLKDRIQIEGSEFVEMAKTLGTSSLPTSAKTGKNVEKGFQRIAEAMMEKILKKGARRKVPPKTHVEVTSLIEAVDFLMADFCEKYGDSDHAMDIVRQQFKNASLDIHSVDKEGIRRVLDNLERVERDYKGEKQARVNRLYRLRMLRKVLHGDGGSEADLAEREQGRTR